MPQKIKKSLFIFLSVFLGLFYPVASLAGWPERLATWIARWPIFFIFWLTTNIAIFFVGLAGSLLNWVLSPNFISYSYTNPGGPNGNPIIETGLGVTRGFVNMLLVLVLVYIAIATILRLAGYETKKLLVTFIIVALLVNFAPVICGLIVDASNIIMNFFVQDLKADAFGEAMGRKVGEIAGDLKEAQDWEQVSSNVMQLAVLTPFLLALTFVLLIFTLIFALRYMVIWLLVILSPLAFVAYILPATRKYFEQWWQQFLAWTFIGVTCGFFLYLGLMLAVNIQAGSAVPTPTSGQRGNFDSILPYFVSLIFLGIGIVFGLQTSAIGAKVTMQGFIRGGKAATKVAVKRGPKLIRSGAMAAGSVVGATASAVGATARAVARMPKTYRAGRELGLSPYQAAGESVKRGWQRRIQPATVTAIKATAGAVRSVGKGTLSAVRDTGEAFFRAAFKTPKKKKGQVTCKQCGSVVSAGDFCSNCGEKLD